MLEAKTDADSGPLGASNALTERDAFNARGVNNNSARRLASVTTTSLLPPINCS